MTVTDALVVIGGSWGATEALATLLAALPASFALPIAVALHRSTDSAEALARSLQRHTELRVLDAEDKMQLVAGQVVLAPANYHLLIDDDHVALSTDEPLRFSRPSIDILFETAADSYRDRLVAVLLTGANDDGARGMTAVKARGGRTFVQDPSTAERREMPDAAIATGAVDRALPLHAIAAALATLDGST
jgi:two-component system chemotaxis response regulator CheB